MDRIPLAEPLLAGNEERYLLECLSTNFVSSVGPFVPTFEQAFARSVGSRYAVACASGTASLHIAIRLAGAKRGTLVAVPTLTFIASASAACYTAAEVLLVDSEPDTWNMDGARLYDELHARARRGQRLPKIVEIVQLLGHPADMEPILAAASEFDIVIVEDAAEALGASWTRGSLAGRQVGTAGCFGCFSFNGNKIITAGGGGMIVTDDVSLADHARHLTTHARLPGPEYVHDEIGYNYRLTNVAAALGLAQLEQLSVFLDRKRAIAGRYREGLMGGGVEFGPSAAWAAPSFWLSTVLFDDAETRATVMSRLHNCGIDARPIWRPLHLQDPFRGAERIGGEVAEGIFARALALPSSVGLSTTQQDRVINEIVETVRL